MTTGQTNPTQWPKFEHAGMWYVTQCGERLKLLEIPATYIQRWWRQRNQPQKKKKKLSPLFLRDKFVPLAGIIDHLSAKDPALLQNFRAYEKLDGTNLGVRCDGAVFGRRQRIYGDSYQKVPLTGVIPTAMQAQAIRQEILGSELQAENGGIELVLYGELMCNPGKFDYTERAMGLKFYSFGGMLQFPATNSRDEVVALQEAIQQRGFAAFTGGNHSSRVALNHKLRGLVEGQGIPCVPLLDEGPFGDLSLRMKETLMKDGMEGVVLTSDDGKLLKWKTSIEDESKTHSFLCEFLQQHPHFVLEAAGVDLEVVKCLIDVAEKKVAHCQPPRKNGQSKKAKKKKAKKGSASKEPYDNYMLDSAFASALTKYDALEAYFARDDRDTIIALLNKELTDDLGAAEEDQVRCIAAAIGKRVGFLYGKWKKTQGEPGA